MTFGAGLVIGLLIGCFLAYLVGKQYREKYGLTSHQCSACTKKFIERDSDAKNKMFYCSSHCEHLALNRL